ncbi:hypothetical protein HOD29_07240 [archaeon]|jgi:hypothetical protein|nr:hypothetical protein [archaeon]
MQNLLLTIELIPESTFFKSLHNFYKYHSNGSIEDWQRIKKKLRVLEGDQCWICGAEGGRLEAHEFYEFEFYEGKPLQNLMGIHHLCKKCHMVKHFEFWMSKGYDKKELVEHFCKVNKCSEEIFDKHKIEAVAAWREKNKFKWSVNLMELLRWSCGFEFEGRKDGSTEIRFPTEEEFEETRKIRLNQLGLN